MKYNILGYLVGEGFSNVFKNKKSTGASLMIMCATMIIFGVFLILGENINHFVKEIESAQGIQVFIKNEATQEQIEDLEQKIRKIDGVSKTEFVSKEQALNQMKEKFGDKKDLLEIIGKTMENINEINSKDEVRKLYFETAQKAIDLKLIEEDFKMMKNAYDNKGELKRSRSSSRAKIVIQQAENEKFDN